jgi:outer membrane protein assembly factor BamE (lipoprotein component of BamABCDE complex)
MHANPRCLGLLLATAGVLSGCVLPVPLREDTVLAGTPLLDQQFAFIEPAVTTDSDVIARLGRPTISWEDARVITYDWEMRRGVLLWAVGGPYVGHAGITDIPAHHVLIIEFDDAGRVRRFDHTTLGVLEPYSRFLLEWKAAGQVAPPADSARSPMPSSERAP